MPYDTIFNPLKQRTPSFPDGVSDKDKPFYSDCNQGPRFFCRSIGTGIQRLRLFLPTKMVRIEKHGIRKMDHNHKSRTQRKNEDRALHMLGQELVDLSSEQLNKIKIPDEILEAVRFVRKITRHGARRRQIQRIRALLRDVDVESIQNALEIVQHRDNRQALVFKKIENWRNELQERNKALIEEILSLCPDAERQRLSQLARNANKEYVEGKGVKSSRLLFRYLRQISDPLSFSKIDKE